MLDSEDRAVRQEADREPGPLTIRLGSKSSMRGVTRISDGECGMAFLRSVRSRSQYTQGHRYGRYETVFEFDANFKRTVKIRSPKSAQAAVAVRYVASQTLRLDQHRFGQRRDGVELQAGESPSCSRQYKFKPRKKARFCVGRSNSPLQSGLGYIRPCMTGPFVATSS